jgi:hypothetical protein
VRALKTRVTPTGMRVQCKIGRVRKAIDKVEVATLVQSANPSILNYVLHSVESVTVLGQVIL